MDSERGYRFVEKTGDNRLIFEASGSEKNLGGEFRAGESYAIHPWSGKGGGGDTEGSGTTGRDENTERSRR